LVLLKEERCFLSNNRFDPYEYFAQKNNFFV